jgi:hypothetical protein
MNILTTALVALAISGLGNLWLFNSRGAALKDLEAAKTDLRYSRALAQQCSDSVDALTAEAKAAKEAHAAALALARESAKGLVASGLNTLSAGRSDPADDCASTRSLVDTWYQNRGRK